MQQEHRRRHFSSLTQATNTILHPTLKMYVVGRRQMPHIRIWCIISQRATANPGKHNGSYTAPHPTHATSASILDRRGDKTQQHLKNPDSSRSSSVHRLERPLITHHARDCHVWNMRGVPGKTQTAPAPLARITPIAQDFSMGGFRRWGVPPRHAHARLCGQGRVSDERG